MILHLLAAADWDRHPRDAPFRPASLDSEGFVHCTGDEPTLLHVANTFYRDLPGELVVLDIDEARLTSPVLWEAPVPAPPAGSATALFPHIYGPIDLEAVVEVRRMVRTGDGTCVGYAARNA